MSTGTQGACAIADTEVNTNRQVIMRAGLRKWVIKLYFLFEVIIRLSFLLVFVFFAPRIRMDARVDGPSATLVPLRQMRTFALRFVFSSQR